MIALISTGTDTFSRANMQSLLTRLQTGDVWVLSIFMLGPLRNGNQGNKQQIKLTNQGFERADAWLKILAEATDGRTFSPENAQAFQ